MAPDLKAKAFSDEDEKYLQKRIKDHRFHLETEDRTQCSRCLMIRAIAADRKRIEELIETVKWQGEKIIRQHKNLGEYTELCRTEAMKSQFIADQTAEIERLRGALEFYMQLHDKPNDIDGGLRARQALDAKEE